MSKKFIIAFYHPQNSHPEWVQDYTAPYHLISSKQALLEAFVSGQPIIGFCAAAILIRQLAPMIKDKWREPPLLALQGEIGNGFIIPLLGGHRGGNRLATQLADLWQLQPIITTASDRLGFAPDDPPPNWKIIHGRQDKMQGKILSAKLLAGEKILAFANPENLFESFLASFPANDTALPLLQAASPEQADIILSPFIHDGTQFQLCPQIAALGVGMIRGCDFTALETLLFAALEKAGLAVESVMAIASVTLKDNESALHFLAKKYDWQLRFFTNDALDKVAVPNPSDNVRAEIGIGSVAEAAAILLADTAQNPQLIVEKQKNTNATCAISLAKQPIPFDRLAGERAGYLTLVGLGPGDACYRVAAASQRLAEAEVIIGYGLYLAQISDEFPRAEYIALPLGAETERARLALDYAAKGYQTILAASGDPGIYALASLVMEQAETLSHPPMVEIIPGITAMQMLAARVGAPMGHDFCAISLSDLLTPEEVIKKRISAAAAGDFVVSFYNPQSRSRRQLLDTAIKILREYRSPDVPVIIGRNLARPDEHVEIIRLEDFDPTPIDMFSLVMVGANETRISQAFGKNHAFTPRGYAQKNDKPIMKKKDN